MDTKESVVFRKKLASLLQVAGTDATTVGVNRNGWVEISNDKLELKIDLENIKTIGLLKPDCISTLPSLKTAKEIYNIKEAFNADCIFEIKEYEIISVKRAYN